MAFYSPIQAMEQFLTQLVGCLEREGHDGLSDHLSITWLRYCASARQPAATAKGGDVWALPVSGASWRGSQRFDPAHMVQLFYLVAAEAWQQRQLISTGPELRRALAAMARTSSHEATGLIVDLLSGTTSGPSLPDGRFQPWAHQRQLVNDWLAGLDWKELQSCNVCQKTWGDSPYGRERDFFGPAMENRNRLSTDATARMLHAVIAGGICSPPACGRLRELLLCQPDRSERATHRPGREGGLIRKRGFIADGLPSDAQVWGKSGWSFAARHDAAYVEVEGACPFLVVVFSEGERCALDLTLLPSIASAIVRGCSQSSFQDS